MRFTAENKYLIKCSRVSKTYIANHFLNMFSDIRWSFGGRKTLIKKEMIAMISLTRVRLVVDHTLQTRLQKSTKLKISH